MRSDANMLMTALLYLCAIIEYADGGSLRLTALFAVAGTAFLLYRIFDNHNDHNTVI